MSCDRAGHGGRVDELRVTADVEQWGHLDPASWPRDSAREAQAGHRGSSEPRHCPRASMPRPGARLRRRGHSREGCHRADLQIQTVALAGRARPPVSRGIAPAWAHARSTRRGGRSVRRRAPGARGVAAHLRSPPELAGAGAPAVTLFERIWWLVRESSGRSRCWCGPSRSLIFTARETPSL
jgi:hypothetical protein